MIDYLNALGAGIVGALALALMTDLSRGVGLIDANLARYQGCIVLGRSEGMGAWLAGMAVHLAMGSVLALGYALIFAVVWGQASWTTGALIGLAHGLAAGAGFPMLDRMNPCVRDGRMRGFGLFGRGYGWMMTAGLLMGHIVYGAIVGWLYAVPQP
jgi:hypothetical protein